ncbi:NUDIX domain-containing protein [Qipengyuania sp. 1NDH17]|uniref:NUDIX domain-containing protein n=1 Tax=Qipengyuania polymorpha TaxID=2867234 RepID=A0ABS7IXB7_9SPHN|nr:NUDIX domain-containing protein [Qipengyuania polymorpha]
MLHLIPAPLHRFALRVAHNLRQQKRRATGKTRDGVTVVGRDFDGQILLVRHSYGPNEWFFPGGGIGDDESPEEAAMRELMEETACEITGMKLVGIIDETLSGAPHKDHLFEGVVSDMPEADGREIVDARFFPTHSLPEPLSPRTRERLKMWQARKS